MPAPKPGAVMRRREFIAALGAAPWPAVAGAQQAKMPVVGVLHSGLPAHDSPTVTACKQGLKEAGYIGGRNVAIEYRWAEDHDDRLPSLAADLVHRQVTVIFANTSSAPAAK